MTQELLAEFVGLLGDGTLTGARLVTMLEKVFATLSDDRHAQLFSWLTLEPPAPTGESTSGDDVTRDLLAMLLQRVRGRDGLPPLDADPRDLELCWRSPVQSVLVLRASPRTAGAAAGRR
ncbi:MAG: hypothetical protein HC809_15740 [Gammaproteobacteria bacterium]|nr:hypothetical protein [Gammaproteobacteria bacterium]